MARSAEDILKDITGNLVLQIAGLTARAEAAEEQLASAKSVPMAPTEKPA